MSMPQTTHAERVLGLELSTDSQPASWRAKQIAQALADLRAKYEAVATELERESREPGRHEPYRYACGIAADSIRQVARD